MTKYIVFSGTGQVLRRGDAIALPEFKRFANRLGGGTWVGLQSDDDPEPAVIHRAGESLHGVSASLNDASLAVLTGAPPPAQTAPMIQPADQRTAPLPMAPLSLVTDLVLLGLIAAIFYAGTHAGRWGGWLWVIALLTLGAAFSRMSEQTQRMAGPIAIAGFCMIIPAVIWFGSSSDGSTSPADTTSNPYAGATCQITHFAGEDVETCADAAGNFIATSTAHDNGIYP